MQSRRDFVWRSGRVGGVLGGPVANPPVDRAGARSKALIAPMVPFAGTIRAFSGDGTMVLVRGERDEVVEVLCTGDAHDLPPPGRTPWLSLVQDLEEAGKAGNTRGVRGSPTGTELFEAVKPAVRCG